MSSPTLINLANNRELCSRLRIEESFLDRLIAEDYQVHYGHKGFSEKQISENPFLVRSYKLQKHKKSKNYRLIHVAGSQEVQTLLKLLNVLLSDIYSVPDCVHGYIKNRSIKTNAQQHLAKQYLYKTDLHDFFDHIDSKLITKSLIDIGVEREVSKSISCITTIDGNIPQGFSTSPVISNIIFTTLDLQIDEYVKSQNAVYTRYADDISISSDSEFDFEGIKSIIEKYGFKINIGKTLTLKRGFYQSVTGLTIFDENMPRLPKRVKKRLRLEVYYIQKFGIKNHAIRNLASNGDYNKSKDKESIVRAKIEEIRNNLTGWINYSKAIEPVFGAKLESQFSSR